MISQLVGGLEHYFGGSNQTHLFVPKMIKNRTMMGVDFKSFAGKSRVYRSRSIMIYLPHYLNRNDFMILIVCWYLHTYLKNSYILIIIHFLLHEFNT